MPIGRPNIAKYGSHEPQTERPLESRFRLAASGPWACSFGRSAPTSAVNALQPRRSPQCWTTVGAFEPDPFQCLLLDRNCFGETRSDQIRRWVRRRARRLARATCCGPSSPLYQRRPNLGRHSLRSPIHGPRLRPRTVFAARGYSTERCKDPWVSRGGRFFVWSAEEIGNVGEGYEQAVLLAAPGPRNLALNRPPFFRASGILRGGPFFCLTELADFRSRTCWPCSGNAGAAFAAPFCATGDDGA